MTLPNELAQFTLLAQAEYSCDSYGAGAYGVCETTGTSTSTDGSSSLVNTGITAGIFIGLAVLILFLALVVRFLRKKKTTGTQNMAAQKQNPTQPPQHVQRQPQASQSSEDQPTPPRPRPPQPPIVGG